jgi:tripeptide aminopeptidase
VSVGTLDLDTTGSTGYRIEAAFLGFAGNTSVIAASARAIAALKASGSDDRTSIRVQAIDGGGSLDEAPGQPSLVAEVCSPSDEQAEAVVAEVIDCLHDAANRPECTSDVDISVRRISGLAR